MKSIRDISHFFLIMDVLHVIILFLYISDLKQQKTLQLHDSLVVTEMGYDRNRLGEETLSVAWYRPEYQKTKFGKLRIGYGSELNMSKDYRR